MLLQKTRLSGLIRLLLLDRIPWLLVNSLHVKGSFCIRTHWALRSKWMLRVNSYVLNLPKASPCFQKSFENTMGKGEIARNEQFLLFTWCFMSFWRAFCHFHQIQNCRLQTLSVKSLLKTLLEQEKLLVTSNFSFSHGAL